MRKTPEWLKNLKQWLFKVSASALIFISMVLLGGAIVTMALPSSLEDIKSINANNQLTSGSWDYLVDYVNSMWKKSGNDLYYNSGNVGIGTTTSTVKLSVEGGVKV
jgi:archaellum component FlaF (FlaF/FlaG flagellin family)